MQYLVQVQEIIYSYLNNEPMEIVLGTFMIFLAIAVISAICFFLSLRVLRAKAFWLLAAYVLLFSVVFILINRYGFAISFDLRGMILILAGVLIAASSALIVSEGFYRPMQLRKKPSAGRWRFVSFVLSFSLIATIMEMIYLFNIALER